MSKTPEGKTPQIRPVMFGGRFAAETLAGPLVEMGFPLSAVITQRQENADRVAAAFGAQDAVAYTSERGYRAILDDQRERHPDDTIATVIAVPHSQTLAVARAAIEAGVPALTLKFGTGYDHAEAVRVAELAGNGVYGAGQFWEHYQSDRARTRMFERMDERPVVSVRAAWHGEPHHSIWGLTEGRPEEVEQARAEGRKLDASGGPMADRGSHLLWFLGDKIGTIRVTGGAEYRYPEPVRPEQTTADACRVELSIQLHTDGREVPGSVTTYSRRPPGSEQVYISLTHDDKTRTIVTKKQLLIVDAQGTPVEEPIDHTDAYQGAGRSVTTEFLVALKYQEPEILVCNFADAAVLFGHIAEGQQKMHENRRLIKNGKTPAELMMAP